MSEQQVCAECGGISEVVYPPGASRIQHVDIALPTGKSTLTINEVPLYAVKHYALWLHPECEAACIERLEREIKEQQ